MHYVLAMHFFDALTNLAQLARGLGLLELLFLLHQRVERPLLHVLDQHVEVLGVSEEAIHFY